MIMHGAKEGTWWKLKTSRGYWVESGCRRYWIKSGSADYWARRKRMGLNAA